MQEEEGTCIGQWSKRCCNHWISTDAVVQYICQEAEEQRFRMRCPVCSAARCERCALHGGAAQRDGGCCYIPPRQIRELLSEDQMARCGPLRLHAQRLQGSDSAAYVSTSSKANLDLLSRILKSMCCVVLMLIAMQLPAM